MRFLFKKLLLSLLATLSRRIIRKYNPQIIGITGSYGKTSAREAIFAVLNTEIEEKVRMTVGELNGEWGMPLAIIGGENPHGSAFKWIGIVFKGIRLLLVKQSYPNILLLEMAAERPGDIDYLVSMAQPHIAVMTGIGNTHLEFFGSAQEVAKEKFKLVTGLHEEGTVIYNKDDNFLSEFIPTVTVSHKISYGIDSKNTDIDASEINFELNDLAIEKSTADSPEHIGGVGFVVRINQTDYQAYIANVVGRAHIYAALAALAAGRQFNVPVEQSIAQLKHFKPAPGRLRLISGIKNTIIIDDSYNSSPDAAELSLETLAQLDTQGKRWAVLGEMMELGEMTEDSHRRVGTRVAELNVDYLITVGSPALFIAHGARDAGMNPDRVFEFESKEEAGRFLQNRIQQGDLILLKASRGIRAETAGTRFEKIVKEVMAEPQRARELLVHTY